MAYSHNEVIKTKMTELANIASAAQERITPQILSSAGREMQINLGDTAYQEYMDVCLAFDEPTFAGFDGREFNNLTSDEKALRNLIFAEAYFGLYHLSVALKKLVKGAVHTSREQAGTALIVAAPFDDIIDNGERYLEFALDCIEFATEGNADDSALFSDGTFGAFVV